MLTFKEIPTIEDGYLLEPSKGWFGVVVPKNKENLIINPNFINYPTNTSNLTTTNALLSSNSNGIFTPHSLLINFSTNGILTYTTPSNLTGNYTFSVYVRTLGNPGSIGISFNGANVKNYDITNNYKRISYTSAFTNNDKVIITGSDLEIEITAMQLELGYLTTFFSGDTELDFYDSPNSYKWTGEKYKSTSIRTDGAYSGGEIISLYEYGFKITSIEGLGYPDLTPIIYELATSNDTLYSFSNIEQRTVSINGILLSDKFTNLATLKGLIGKLFYKLNKPSRIYFTPYEFCEENVPTIYFDFIYTGGLNEEINTWFGEEISIEGITLSPCIYNDIPYKFISTHLNDMKFSTNSNDLFFITSDNKPIKSGVPQYTAGSNYRLRVLDAVEHGGVLYALIEQSTATLTQSHFVSYVNGTWTRIVTTDITNALVDSFYNSYGHFGVLESVPRGEYTEGVWVGGYFKTNALSLGIGVSKVGISAGDSLFRYIPSTKQVQVWDVRDSDSPTDLIGAINDISYNQDTGNIFIAGKFTAIQEPNFSQVYTTDNIIKLNVVEPFISLLNSGNGIPFAGSGGATGGIGYGDTSTAQIKKVLEINNDVYILCNGYLNTYNVTTNLTSFFMRYNKISDGLISTPFPFVSESVTVPNGSMLDIHLYKNMILTTGRFTQANSNFIGTNPNYNQGNDYISNVSYFNPLGRTIPFNNFYGAHQPLQNYRALSINGTSTLYDLGVATGLYNNTTNEDSPLSPDSPYIKIDELNNNILFFGALNSYGRSDNKKTCCGFVEYISKSATDLSYGYFVPASLDISNGICWPFYKSFKNLYNIKALVGQSQYPLVSQLVFFYNSGLQIDSCSDSLTDVEIYVDSDNGIINFYGLRNLTTGKYIYFEGEDILPNYLFTIKIIDNTLYLINSNGNTTTPLIYESTGNPLLAANDDVIQVLFDMKTTNQTSNPSFTAKYKQCFFSFDEFMMCR